MEERRDVLGGEQKYGEPIFVNYAKDLLLVSITKRKKGEFESLF